MRDRPKKNIPLTPEKQIVDLENELDEYYLRFQKEPGNTRLDEMITEHEKRIKALKDEIEAKKSYEAGAKFFEDKVDIENRALGIAGTTGNILKQTGHAIAGLAMSIPPIAAAVGGIVAIWDSVKVLTSKAESTWGKAGKIAANTAIVGISIAALLIAPIVAVFLGAASVLIGAVKGQINPWRESSNKVNQKQKSLADINRELASNPNQSALIQKRDQVQKELHDLRTDEWDKRKKMFNGVASTVGAAMLAVPIPPVPLIGLGILLLTSIVGIVQRYNVFSRLRNYFGFGKNQTVMPAAKPHGLSADEKLSAPQPELQSTEKQKKQVTLGESTTLHATEELIGIHHPEAKRSSSEIKRAQQVLTGEINAVQTASEKEAAMKHAKKEQAIKKENQEVQSAQEKNTEKESEGESEKETGFKPGQHK